MRILVVDDEAELLAEVCSFLSRRGHEPTCAGGVREAVAILNRERFAAVLTDMRMPDGSGIDVLRVANAIDPSMLKIVMTGQATDDELDTARDEGVRHVCFKPLSLKELRAALIVTDFPAQAA